MDYLLLGRIAKVAALLGFVLPWVTVSCSGNEILSATGWQLMTGDPQPAEGLQGQVEMDDLEQPAPFVILAFVVIAIGLIVSFLTKAKLAAAALIVGGLGGAGLAYYSVQNMRAELTREMNEAQQETPDTGGFLSEEQTREMSQALGAAIRVEEEEGYWLTLVAALIAAVLGLLSIASARRETSAPPPTG